MMKYVKATLQKISLRNAWVQYAFNALIILTVCVGIGKGIWLVTHCHLTTAKQACFQIPLKLVWPNSWIVQIVRQ